MKKRIRVLSMIMVVVMMISLVPCVQINAATKKKNVKAKVTYNLKKGTLTIKGKGKMPSSMTFKNNKKIKKVVIKKGVTSISDRAFSGCKNLKEVKISSTVKNIGIRAFEKTAIKKIVIPKEVKTIGHSVFNNCKKLEKITMPGKFKFKEVSPKVNYWYKLLTKGCKVKTIKFNTPLSIKTTSYVQSENLIPSKNDTKFTNIDGVIYTKDKTEIVRVPGLRTNVSIEEGCKVFNLQSIMYATVNVGHDITSGEYGCNKLEHIYIASTVEKIDYTKFKGEEVRFLHDVKFTIATKKLDGENISNLSRAYGFDLDIEEYEQWYKPQKPILSEIVKKRPEILKEIINETESDYETMYIASDGTLVYYSGNGINGDGIVYLPENVKTIGKDAFWQCGGVKQIVFSDGTIITKDSL